MSGGHVLSPEEGASLKPFEPMRITSAQARLACTLGQRRKPFETTVGSSRLRLRPLARTQSRNAHAITFELGGMPVRIELDRALRHRLLEIAREDLPLLQLPDEVEMLVLERLFEHVLPKLERIFGAISPGDGPTAADRCGQRDFAVRIDGEGTRHVTLTAPFGLLQQIDTFWRQQPVLRRDMPQLPLTVALRAIRTRLDAIRIGELGPGDIVFADASPAEKGCFLGVVEETLALPLRVDGDHLQIMAAPVPLRRLSTPWQPMIEDLMPEELDVDEDRTWGDVPVDLVFELQRVRLPLGQLQSMEPGYVLELERPLSEAVDIRVRGRRIGRGELVVVQNRLGVRVVSLNGEAGEHAVGGSGDPGPIS